MTASLENINRRRFLKLTGIAGSGLVLGATLPLSSPVWAAHPEGAGSLNLFVSIDADETVNIICHRSEMGQGIRTGVPQVVAEELCADWAKVKVIQGLANEEYGSQNTDGSRSIRRFYTILREMGASARSMLEQAAASEWNVKPSQVYAENGFVLLKGKGKKLSFGQLAKKASELKAPDKASLTFKSPDKFVLIGKPIDSIDVPDMVVGRAQYGRKYRAYSCYWR